MRVHTFVHVFSCAAVLITPNGSIRLSVMMNPVRSLPLHLVTCRCQHLLLPPSGPLLSARTDGAMQGPLWPLTRSPERDPLLDDSLVGLQLIWSSPVFLLHCCIFKDLLKPCISMLSCSLLTRCTVYQHVSSFLLDFW